MSVLMLISSWLAPIPKPFSLKCFDAAGHDMPTCAYVSEGDEENEKADLPQVYPLPWRSIYLVGTIAQDKKSIAVIMTQGETYHLKEHAMIMSFVVIAIKPRTLAAMDIFTNKIFILKAGEYLEY